MQKLLASYLLRNRNCPLPGIGSLQLIHEDSTYDWASSKITPPRSNIRLFNQDLDANGLIEFISYKTNLPLPVAEKRLDDFCSHIKKLKRGQEVVLPSAGKFTKVGHKVEFVSQNFSDIFFQPVYAQAGSKAKQIQPSADETLVADIEEPIRSSFFAKLGWAWVLLLAALLCIGYILFTKGLNGMAHQSTITPQADYPTYTIPTR